MMDDMQIGTISIAILSSIILGVVFWIIQKITNI